MIIIEDMLTADVETMNAIQMNSSVSKKPSFHSGDELELNRYLALKKDAAYPLIWLLPEEEDHIRYMKAVRRNCTFIIATKETRSELFNNERFANSYKIILNPVAEAFEKLLHKYEIIGDVKIFKRPNYSNSNKNGTTELWDALTIKVEVIFSEC